MLFRSRHPGGRRRGGEGHPDQDDEEVEDSEDEESRRRRSEAASLQNSIQRWAWMTLSLQRVHDAMLTPTESGDASGEGTA